VKRLALGLCLTAGALGCQRDFVWKSVLRIEAGPPSHFYMRKNGELWGWGATAARRTGSGWEWVNACALSDADARLPAQDGAVSLAFGADGVWALCGGNRLLRWADDGSHVEVPLPQGEQAFGVATLVDGWVLSAAHGFYAFDGAAWQKVAPNGAPPNPGSTVDLRAFPVTGYSTRSFYSGASSGDGLLLYWDGSAWTPVDFGNPGTPNLAAQRGELSLRGDKAFVGYYALSGASGTTHLPQQAVAVRPVAFLSVLDDGSYLFESRRPGAAATDDPAGFLWEGAPGDEALTYLGGDAVGSPRLPVKSVGGVYAIDDRLIIFASDALLIEGTR
jgi:hypothetical protein